MKKVFKMFLFAIAFIACGVFAACNSCSSNKAADEILTYPVAGLNVEDVQGSDLQWMCFNYGTDWQWMECCVDMKDFIDEADTCEVLAVANIFKVLNIDSATGGFMPIAVLVAHTADTTIYEVKEGLWVGDNDLKPFNNPFEVDFQQAWNKMMEANCPKPHSKHCVLRKEVGPKDCNPLYIFGNQDMQVYIDVVTGKVSTTNPVFEGFGKDSLYAGMEDVPYDGVIYGPRNTRIGCPLGEWP